ncbi:MAG: beta-ketoacyl-ACP synthase III [Deltaproteobacteria bacterium]|nr:beta-ketoacyl-ACP synthase III [Deltaproteobacteria bacterium]
MEVFINDVAAFLPNAPVDNDHIESVVGAIHGIPSRIKNRILKNNGITQRYYAIDPATGALTHTNAQLTAEAVRGLAPYPGFTPEAIECLCCGTTIADLLAPGHGLMVHGELGTPPCEVTSNAGICLSAIASFKYAFMNVALGFSANAVATGSELASAVIRSNFFDHLQGDPDLARLPIIGFESDFLRWMLSDAAGAVFMSPQVYPGKKALRVDWIDHISYAGRLETCMYAGGLKNEDGSISSWRHLDSIQEALDKNYMALKQDAGLLNEEIVKVSVDWALAEVIKKRGLKAEDIDWFLPHYSSDFFRDKIYEAMKGIDFTIPYEKWFTNLPWKGNTGSASIFVILEELFHSDRLQKGQKLLCFIPESGRFSIAYMLLTVV